MAKKRKATKNASVKATRAARRRSRPGAGLTSGATGLQGAKAYWKGEKGGPNWGQPKERTGASYTTIVLSDPKRGQRTVAVGSKGGIYAQKKWDSTKAIVAALPLAAAATTAIAFAGMKLREHPTIASWATWYPGGYTGMALTAGGVGAYVAYRHRYVVGLVAFAALTAYAFIKLAMSKLASVTGTPDPSTNDVSPYAPGQSTPALEDNSVDTSPSVEQSVLSEQENLPSLGRGKADFIAARQAMKSEDYDSAIRLLNLAFKKSGEDPTIIFYLAECYFKKGLTQPFKKVAVKDGVKVKIPADFITAKALYNKYISDGVPTLEVDEDGVSGAKEWASDRLRLIAEKEKSAAAGIMANEAVIDLSGRIDPSEDLSGEDDDSAIDEVLEEEEADLSGEEQDEEIEDDSDELIEGEGEEEDEEIYEYDGDGAAAD